MTAVDLQRKIWHELSGGWLMIGLGVVACLGPLVLGGDNRILMGFGVVTAMLGASVVRSTHLLREVANRVLDAERSEGSGA